MTKVYALNWALQEDQQKIDTLKETVTTLLRKCSSVLYTITNESKSARLMLAPKNMWGKRNKKAQFTLHKVLTNKLWQHVAI